MPADVDMDGKPYAAELGIVVNAGSRAAIPPIEGLGAVAYWTNHQLVETKELPSVARGARRRAIGCELGQALARFGVT